MAVKNCEIIAAETLSLIQAGTIGPDEVIHTYAGWKEIGYQVRKGEKAVTQFVIWKAGKPSKKAIENGKDPDGAHLFMKKSSWFSTSQVDKITATA